MPNELNKILEEALQHVANAPNLTSLQEIEVKYLGRKGELSEIMHCLKDLPDEEKRTFGPACNQAKNTLLQEIAHKKLELENEEIKKNLSTGFFDTSIPGKEYDVGHIHPLAQIQYEVEHIFSDMGFSVMDGPEIESEYYNFEGLNVPADHPARDMQDTFFIKDREDKKHGRLVLRTQTSPIQIRTMERYGAPLRVIAPGRTFRNEATDASHEHTFHQIEGLLVDKDISLAHLKGIMTEFLSRLFRRKVKVRFRPGYFPFVEPGLELDFSCLICNEKGCSVCKRTGWMEFMGAGMVHPNVLKAGGIDSSKYQGWAFGFGLERLAIMRYGIEDIRLFHGGDLRFLEQF